MTRQSRLGATLLVVLAFTQPMLAQPASPDAERWRVFSQRLEAGARIQVRLRDGTSVRGTLVSVDETALQVLPYTRVELPVRSVAFREIDFIDRWHRGWMPGTKTLVGIGVGFGILLTVAAVVGALYD
jgi:hypothetical protein